MQFKVSKNSIFAYLLRSPWWVSLCLALIVGALSGALLSGIFGMAAVSFGLPFLLVSAIAGWQQMQLPSAARIESTIAAAAALSGKEFLAAMQQGYERDGYTVKRCNGAADFLITKEGRSSLVCCKRWKAASHSVEPLHELLALREEQQIQGAVFVAVNELSKDAQLLARNNGIELMQAADITRLLGKLDKSKMKSASSADKSN